MKIINMIKNLWKWILDFLGKSNNITPNQSSKVFIAETFGADKQLSNVEISFLKLLEGKRADDSSVLGWWCAFNNIDGSKIINKLSMNNYLTLADYKFNVRKATIPILKDFLIRHELPIRGKKPDLVNRIIENISEADCLSYFKQSYWALSPKAVELLHAEGIKAEAEYNKNIELIRSGSYNELKRKLYPNKNQQWGTELTFIDTIDFIMNHGFEEFSFSEDIRRAMSSFIAARAVDYSSRGYSTCQEDISRYLRSLNIASETLKLPLSLVNYAKEIEIENFNDIFKIYIQFIIYRARAVAELNNYKSMGIKRIKIDTVGCWECGLSKRSKAHDINKAPILPSSWNCQCSYTPVLRDK
jgi:hypothetical protein